MTLSVLLPTLAAATILSANALAQPRLATTLLPPISGACISSPFGPRVLAEHPAAGSYHYGVDLPAPLGSAVLATAPGTVLRVQRKGPGGLEMLVQHDGFLGIYSHFGMITPAFAEGKRTVVAGEKLGVVGRTGLTSGAHLFFEMVLDGKPVDPAKYLGLPLCPGVASHAPADMPDDGGTTIDGKKYWLFGVAARQYHQWPQH